MIELFAEDLRENNRFHGDDLVQEKLYGCNLSFSFDHHDVSAVLEKETVYSPDVKNRASEVLLEQRRKYSYLFK